VSVALAVVRKRSTAALFCRAPVVTPVNAVEPLGVVGLNAFRSRLRWETNRPTRTSQRVLADIVCVRSPKFIVGVEMCVLAVASNGVTMVGRSGSRPISS
jgi:hypothetical protein